MNSMERLARPSHPFPPGHSSSPELPRGPGSRRHSGFGCFSISSSPPLQDACPSGGKGTSTENIFFKGLMSEGPRQGEHTRYLHPLLGYRGSDGSWVEDQSASWPCSTARHSTGTVWQVPEQKKSKSPPPPPPLRSDSFAATKVFPYFEQPGSQFKSNSQTLDKLTETHQGTPHQEKLSEQKHNHLPTKDFLHPGTVADVNHRELHPNKLFSLSSNDIRHTQSQFINPPAHQRQYSDESPFYRKTKTSPTQTQSVGSYYRSLQDLPVNASSNQQVSHSAALMNPNLENGGHSAYYCSSSKHWGQRAEHQARPGQAEGSKGGMEKSHWLNNNDPDFQSSLMSNGQAKFSLPLSQKPYGENREHKGHCHQVNGLRCDQQTLEVSASLRCRTPEDTTKRTDGLLNDMTHFPLNQGSDPKTNLLRHQDPWVAQDAHKISPLKTPLLHSLTQESPNLAKSQPAAGSPSNILAQVCGDATTTSIGGKASRRSDRYATTLRNEIQKTRAQLQKSRSAATLTCEDEQAEDWKSIETPSSTNVSFSNTYKDHLKEAQARVLQATSFQRRDLEPVGPETQAVKTSGGQNPRFRGRKRFPLVKRTHSFSEPDKMDKVGVEVESQTGSFGERRKLFEAFSKQASQGLSSGGAGTKAAAVAQTPSDLNHLIPGHKQVLRQQQRLGTFAEYQATWSKEKKPSEAKKQGRYHSAENILDAEAEEKVSCVHERSRSSPTADFYTQDIPLPWNESARNLHTGSTSPSRFRYQRDRSPQSVPTEPSQNSSGLPDHSAKPDAAATSSQTSLPLRPRSPNPGAPNTKTTSSCWEFLPEAQADPLSSSHAQHHGMTRDAATGPAQSSSPHLSTTPRPGGVESEEEEEPLCSWTAALSLLSADGSRSPSPLFVPLRLTDRPPAASTPKGSPLLRSGNEATDAKSPARKVPVTIVHTETRAEREDRTRLPQSSPLCAVLQPTPRGASLGGAERSASSMFRSYTRQAAPGPGLGSVSDSQGPEGPTARDKRSDDDAKREELVRDIMGKDKTLVDILNQSSRRTTMDLMEGLFPQEDQILEGSLPPRRVSAGSRLRASSPRSADRLGEEGVSTAAVASLVPSSSYYSTSAPKAELLIKMKDMQEQLEEQDSEDELDVDLAEKKTLLIASLAEKLEVLREARQSLQEDVEDNEALGRDVEAIVQRRCQPNQLDKFRMFVGDLDKVVSLLLSLSGRLARVENALNSLDDGAPPDEKRTLTNKRQLLLRQHDDAKELKENLDRRERLVTSIMEAHLDAESLDDYRYFVKMKSALIIEQRKLGDKIKLGEEQLKCLMDSLPPEQMSKTPFSLSFQE